MKDTVTIKMFGDFSVSHKGHSLTEAQLKMNQLITLLTYMIYNSGRHMQLDNLFTVLWPEENSDNPAHALRNLIYRLRTALKTDLDPETVYIITNENNSYSWNPELNTDCDAVRFDSLIKHASLPELNNDERILEYTEALSLYTGEFLPSLSYQDWIVPAAAYFRHLYMSAAAELTKLLMAGQRYGEALKASLKAIEQDPLDELTHQNIISIYIRLNQYDQAEKHFRYVSGLFKRELGCDVSQETKDIYRQITALSRSIEPDIGEIRTAMYGSDVQDSPLFCDYDNMKCLFSLQLRSRDRVEMSQFLLLITVSMKSGGSAPEQKLSEEMMRLAETLRLCLRKNDVVAAYSPSQYLLMLSLLTYENAEMVASRIRKHYGVPRDGINITYSIVAV